MDRTSLNYCLSYRHSGATNSHTPKYCAAKLINAVYTCLSVESNFILTLHACDIGKPLINFVLTIVTH